MNAIDNPNHLVAWLEAKGYKRLVLRVADVIELPAKEQGFLIELLQRAGYSIGADAEPIAALKEAAGGQFYLIPVGLLRELDMEALVRLQTVLLRYRAIRQVKGHYTREQPCYCANPAHCPHCAGTGLTKVLEELSPTETLLAAGE